MPFSMFGLIVPAHVNDTHIVDVGNVLRCEKLHLPILDKLLKI